LFPEQIRAIRKMPIKQLGRREIPGIAAPRALAIGEQQFQNR
jgi:hypothetical protein